MSYAPECFLAGAMNTRDLGGIRAAGGRTVAKQKLIRSGELSKVTNDDIAKLTHIRLKTIVDLRSPAETSLKMDIIPDGVRYVHCPVVSDLVPGITRESIEDPYDGLKRTDYARDLREGGMAKMRSLYPILVENSNAVKQYRRFFDCVLENDGDGAILFHCAMGKDRAGVAAALLLYALGASMKDIMADYMYTGICCAEKIRRDTDACRSLTGDESLLESVYWLNTTHESYLEAMFESCIRQCGSVDRYLAEKLGITQNKIAFEINVPRMKNSPREILPWAELFMKLMCVEVIDGGLVCKNEVAVTVIKGTEIFGCAAVDSGYLTKLAADRAACVYGVECRLRCADVQQLITHRA